MIPDSHKGWFYSVNMTHKIYRSWSSGLRMRKLRFRNVGRHVTGKRLCQALCANLSMLDSGQNLSHSIGWLHVGLTAWSGTEIIPNVKYRRISAGKAAWWTERCPAPTRHPRSNPGTSECVTLQARWQMWLN